MQYFREIMNSSSENRRPLSPPSWTLSILVIVIYLAILVVMHPLLVISLRISRNAYKSMVALTAYFLTYNLRFLGTSISIKGNNHLDQEHHYIFISNHQSEVDIPLAIWALRSHHPIFVAKRELGRGIPTISHALRNMGAALIDRSQARESLEIITQFGKRLEEAHENALIYPEGTRTKDGEMKRFKSSGLITLIRNMPTAQLVPVVVRGTYDITKWNMFPMPLGRSISLEVLEPIERTGKTEKELISLSENAIRERLSS